MEIISIILIVIILSIIIIVNIPKNEKESYIENKEDNKKISYFKVGFFTTLGGITAIILISIIIFIINILIFKIKY